MTATETSGVSERRRCCAAGCTFRPGSHAACRPRARRPPDCFPRHAAQRLPEQGEPWRAKTGIAPPRVVVADQQRSAACDNRASSPQPSAESGGWPHNPRPRCDNATTESTDRRNRDGEPTTLPTACDTP